jgi:Protein kinase domain.
VKCGVVQKTAVVIYMWYMSLICRNIRLENILLDKDVHCKSVDFGVCALGIFKWLVTTVFGT